MAAKGSMNPEFLEVCVVGDDAQAGSRAVFVNGRERSQGLGRPLLVQPGVHRVTVAGYVTKKVSILGGETDDVAPKVVEFVHPDDLAAGA